MLNDQSGGLRRTGPTTHVNRGGRSLKPLAAGIGLLLLITTSFGSAFASMPGAPLAATAPTLGSAQSFAVLGGSTVTNTGSSVITGDLGVSPGTSVTGFPPGIVNGGTIHLADSLALQAQNAVTTAYNALAAETCTTTFTPPTDLGGKVLIPGVYCFGSTAGLTGVLTLDGQGNSSAVWVFKIGSAITTAPGSSIAFIGAGQSCNVFWQVTSSATIDTSSQFAGNLVALTSITLNTGARLSGRALARNGAVTLDTNNVTAASCLPSIAATATPTVTLPPATQTAVIAATQTAIATLPPATQTAIIGATQTAIATLPPATQTAIIATQTAIIGATQTSIVAATSTAIASTVVVTGVPVGCIGNIRGRKVDGSGTGLAGWTIQLMQGGQVIQSTVTDAAGNFNFLGLPMGAYVIQEVAQNGWVAQTPSSINVTLGACNQNLTGYTFVNAAAASVVPLAQTTTPVARSAATATPAATPVVPRSLPHTGDSPPWIGAVAVLLGALLAIVGLGIARRSRETRIHR